MIERYLLVTAGNRPTKALATLVGGFPVAKALDSWSISSTDQRVCPRHSSLHKELQPIVITIDVTKGACPLGGLALSWKGYGTLTAWCCNVPQ